MSLSRCPSCKAGKVRVIDSRSVSDGRACRRRYACTCGARFTTYEIVLENADVGMGGNDQRNGGNVNLGRLAAKRLLGDTFDPI